MRIIVSGAGIGGLAAASLLSKAGHEVTLLERNPEPNTQGYLMAFRQPGLAVLHELGIWPHVSARNYTPPFIKMQTQAGNLLRVIRTSILVNNYKYGQMQLTIPRPVLYDALIANAQGSDAQIIWGAHISQVENTPIGVCLRLNDNSTLHADLLIVAEGAASSTRSLVFPQQPLQEPLGGYFYSATADKALLGDTSVVSWGKKHYASIHPIEKSQTNAFLVVRKLTPVNLKTDPYENIKRDFSSFPRDVCNFLENMSLENLFADTLYLQHMPKRADKGEHCITPLYKRADEANHVCNALHAPYF